MRLMAILAAVSIAGCARPAPAVPESQRQAGQAGNEVQEAYAAFDALQGRLSRRLMAEMSAGGPGAAIVVCRDEAPSIAAEIAREKGFAMGRTSHRVRNAANAPRAWARPVVEAAAGKKVEQVALDSVVDLGDRVGVLRPIPTGAMCTRCHGDAQALAPEIREPLARAYPDDRATGFEPGDVRGYFWAEVPKR